MFCLVLDTPGRNGFIQLVMIRPRIWAIMAGVRPLTLGLPARAAPADFAIDSVGLPLVVGREIGRDVWRAGHALHAERQPRLGQDAVGAFVPFSLVLPFPGYFVRVGAGWPVLVVSR